jgi:hypothetical protein
MTDDTNHAPITLNSGGGTITVKGPDNSTVDAYSYSSVPSNQSWGRQNDGSPLSIVFDQPTPYSNQFSGIYCAPKFGYQ